MLTVASDRHRLHAPAHELHAGQLVPPFETPQRIDIILERIRDVDLGSVIEPLDFGLVPIQRVHDSAFLAFLETCHRQWQDAGLGGDAMPTSWPARRMTQQPPENIDGRLGYYALAAETAITAGTWDAARSSADVALTAASRIRGGLRSAFALCRPPGHHAAFDLYGGYCFLNNAAIAAQAWRDDGAVRVAILDIDFHHGNGTQDIFYRRGDVLVVNLHGDPRHAFPYFSGFATEIGEGAGEGFNINFPLPPETGFGKWSDSLEDACRRIESFHADGVVVSLGVDTYHADPISFFRLDSDDYSRIGERLARLRLPTLFCLEGGYAVEKVGVNVVNVLAGFEQA